MNKYVKVIDLDGQIVDALDTLNFVKWNTRANMVVNCKDTDRNRMGLLAYDVSTIWHIEGTPEFPAEREYITTNYVGIDKEEFEAIRKAIDEGKEIQPEPEPETEEKETEEEHKQSLQFVKDNKIKYMSYLCNQIIENGITVTLSDGEEHKFSLTEKDQTNLMGRLAQLNTGALQVSYHADNDICIYYSAEDMMKIIQTSMFHIDYQTTYFNSLKRYINSMDSLVDVSAVYYGMEIPEEYQSEPLKDLLVQIGQVQEQNNEENNI